MRRHVLGGMGALFLGTLVAYIPAYRADFIWDDDEYITTNQAVQRPEGLGQIWFKPGATVQYYPLVFSTFWIEHALWGLDPLGYHVVNVALHGVNAVLVWLVLRRLELPGAWFVAALFALHPVQAESVAWVTERKNTLSGLFYLLSALAYLRFRPLAAAAPARTGARTYYVLALLAFLGALLSKTMTLSLPAALLLVTWWKRRRVSFNDVLPLVPMLLIGLGLGALTLGMERYHVVAQGPEWELTLLQRGLIAGRALWFYAAKLLWPVNLSFVYPRWKIDELAPAAYVYPAAALGLPVVLWLVRRHIGRGPLVAVLIYGGTLLPVLGFLNYYYMRYSFVADHFQYIAGLGPLALAGGGVAAALRRAGPVARRTARAVGAVVLVLLAVGVWQRSRVFHDVETLWRDTLARDPECKIAHYNLGNYLKDHGQLTEAVAHYEAAVRIRPDDADARNNLGGAYMDLQRFADAERTLREALQLKTNLSPEFARFNLGLLCQRTGRLDEAIEHYLRGLEIKPGVEPARRDLAALLVRRVDAYLALGQRQQALEFVRAMRDWAAFAGGPSLVATLESRISEAAP